MSEQRDSEDDGCGARLIGIIFGILISIVVLKIVFYEIDKRDYWIYDLQQ